MEIKVTDYIIEKLISNGITDVFGYPGGVITHFMDSGKKYEPEIVLHTLYHEQAAAFAACSYSLASHKTGVAYATSGPGATNLVTGIANAWFDSIPVIFFTGNVDTYGQKTIQTMRQRGFQETEISDIVKPITKFSISVQNPEEIPDILEKAFFIANEGRKGPVLIDLPADVQRAIIEPKITFKKPSENINEEDFTIISELLNSCKKPLVLLGAGIKQTNNEIQIVELLEKHNIPFLQSLPAFDVCEYSNQLNMGWIGANGKRYSNIILDKCDLLLTVGSRLELKQVGNIRTKFCPNAKLVRIDCDEAELGFKVKEDEIQIKADISDFIKYFRNIKVDSDFREWINDCAFIKESVKNEDLKKQHFEIREIQKKFSDASISIDVGQHMLWVAQAVELRKNQKAYMSAGLGSMGYSLPAAIGIYYATRKPVIAFCGDAGFQMNIQEMQFIAKENLPIVVTVIDNYSLGMIRQFQEANFNKIYIHTTKNSGYAVPNFERICEGYSFNYFSVEKIEDINLIPSEIKKPLFIELKINEDTYLTPNWGLKENCYSNMRPEIDQNLLVNLLGGK